MNRESFLRRRIRIWLGVFIVGLVASGLTAFSLLREVEWVARVVGLSTTDAPANYAGLRHWILVVREGLRETYAEYPFMAYGTDWLAFAHVVIAVFFVGPLVRPESNRWVIAAGMIACGLVLILALVCGPIREIPFSGNWLIVRFGVFGFIPLWFAWRDSGELLRQMQRSSSKNPESV